MLDSRTAVPAFCDALNETPVALADPAMRVDTVAGLEAVDPPNRARSAAAALVSRAALLLSETASSAAALPVAVLPSASPAAAAREPLAAEPDVAPEPDALAGAAVPACGWDGEDASAEVAVADADEFPFEAVVPAGSEASVARGVLAELPAVGDDGCEAEPAAPAELSESVDTVLPDDDDCGAGDAAALCGI